MCSVFQPNVSQSFTVGSRFQIFRSVGALCSLGVMESGTIENETRGFTVISVVVPHYIDDLTSLLGNHVITFCGSREAHCMVIRLLEV